MYTWFDNLLGTLTLIGQIGIALFILGRFLRLRVAEMLAGWLKKNVLRLGFLVTLIAMMTSLFYSEIVGILPCELCWWQRVFIYPQVFMFGWALFNRDRSVLPYSLILTFLGGLVAVFQYYLQMSQSTVYGCNVGGGLADCVTISVLEYGYITIPMMSLTLFVWLGLLVIIARDDS